MTTITTYHNENTLTGASLSGSSGSSNRTYTLAYTGYVVGTMEAIVQGSYYYENTDFTISGRVITFLSPVLNTDLINLRYYTSSTSATVSGTPRYTTTEQLARTLGILGLVPTRNKGSTTMSNESLYAGGGAPSTTVPYYLQQFNIINNSETLYTGGTTSSTATSALTRTTHYSINNTTGAILFTSAGSTLVGGTNGVFATYEYITENIPDAHLQNTLLRAEAEVDQDCQTTWTDGTQPNPSYPSIIEYTDSKGRYDRFYFSKYRPVIDIVSTLASPMASSDTSLTLASGTGTTYPVSGTIIIDAEIITYTGISTDTMTGLSRGVNGSTATSHLLSAEVHTCVMECSASYEGDTPTWTALPHHQSMNVKVDTSRWYIFDNQIIGGVYVQNLIHVRPQTPERVRMTYLYGDGQNGIPSDITRLSLIYAKRILASDNILGSIVKGRDEFNPQLFNADMEEAQRIVGNNRRILMGNT